MRYPNANSRPFSRPHASPNREPTALERYNDKQETIFLHATKGPRTISVKRGRAQMLMAEILAGRRGLTTARMGKFLAQG